MKSTVKKKRVYRMFWAALLLSLLLISTVCEQSHSVGHISFASNRTGNFDIYVMDTKGEYLDNLTDHPADDFDPTWSPDGRWIAFVSDRRDRSDIYKVDATGENIRRLTRTGNNGNPVWSADGQWITFVSELDRRFYLYVMTSEGKGLRRFLPAKFKGLLSIAWDAGFTLSPDGKQIACGTWEFQRKPKNIALGVPAEALPLLEGPRPQVPVILSVLDIDAENFRKLTQAPHVGERLTPIPQISRPAWSPNGDWIAYSLSDVGKRWEFSADLHLINVRDTDGIGTPLVKTGGGKFHLAPAWVPDGFLSVAPSTEQQATLWGRLKRKAD